MAIDESDQLLTTNDVADMLKIDRWTVYRLRERGELVPVRIGTKLIRYRLADVRRFIEEGRVTT